MPRLILLTPEGQQLVELKAFNTLGRHPNNTVQLLDKIVSKEHCIVELRDGRFILRDLGSLNGTYINQGRVQGEQALRHGDEISLGSTRARFDDGSSPVPLPPMSPGVVVNSAPVTTAPVHAYAPAPVASVQQPPRSAAAPQPAWASPPAGSAPASGIRHAEPFPAPMGPPSHQAPIPPSAAAPKSAPIGGTRVDLHDQAQAIGTQIAAHTKGFLPFEQVMSDPQQLRLDYERLRLTWELTRDIGLERDLDRLLDKILMSLFKFVNADRGVILLREQDGSLKPRAVRRRDRRTDVPIQVSTTILNHVISEKKSVITHDASMDFAASKGKSMILNRISSAIVAPLLHEQEVLGALWLDSESVAQFQQKDLEIITAVANQASMFIENNLLARKVEQEIVTRERFSRLLSPNVAEQVVAGTLDVKQGGQIVKECTVFNSDIRGFTRMSEGASAEEMVDMLNEYFEEMVASIFRFDGTLDKFMGDGIMALWGAPVVRPNDAVRCVECALEQMEILGKFNRGRIERKLRPLAIGIGIHTGPLVAGCIGSSKALSYTVIGDTANTSARLCSHAQPGEIIVSEVTLAKLGDRFEYEELAPAELKGKEKPMRIFNIKRALRGSQPEIAQALPPGPAH